MPAQRHKSNGRFQTVRHAGATLVAFTLATGMEQWTGNGLSVTLTDLTGALGASADEASWAVTVYSTAFAASVALTHWLASFFGNRRLLSLACLLYALASLGCAASTGLAPFLLCRVLQGFAGGVFLARALVFITHQYPRSERVENLKLYAGGFFAVGRILAPIASGWFADAISWRALFLVAIPGMLVAAGLFHQFAAEHWREDVEEHTPDLLGIGLLLLGVAALQTALSRGEIDDWFSSNRIIILVSVGVASNLLFAAWQLLPRNRRPLLDFHYLSDRGLMSATVLGAALGMQLAGGLYVLPQYLRRVESHSASQTGLLMSITGISAVIMLAIVPQLVRLAGFLGAKQVLALALFAQMVAMGWLGYLVTGDTPDNQLWLPLLLHGIFIGISVPMLAVGAFARMDDAHASSARAIYYGARQLGASLGVTFVVVLIDRRATLHSSRLIDSLFSRNLSTLGVVIDSSNAGRVAALVSKQSLVLTFADVFYVMAALAAVMLLFLPLLPGAPAPAAAGAKGSLGHTLLPSLEPNA